MRGPRHQRDRPGVVDRRRCISRFLSVTGSAHENSEADRNLVDPSGRRMYLASQRGVLGEPGDTPAPVGHPDHTHFIGQTRIIS